MVTYSETFFLSVRTSFFPNSLEPPPAIVYNFWVSGGLLGVFKLQFNHPPGTHLILSGIKVWWGIKPSDSTGRAEILSHTRKTGNVAPSLKAFELYHRTHCSSNKRPATVSVVLNFKISCHLCSLSAIYCPICDTASVRFQLVVWFLWSRDPVRHSPNFGMKIFVSFFGTFYFLIIFAWPRGRPL